MNRKRKLRYISFLILILFVASCWGFINTSSAAPASETVYIIPVTGPIDNGLLKFMERGYREAEAAGAVSVILEINTPGGALEAVMGIKDLVYDSSLKTVTYVKQRALSAGVLVALTGEELVMAPGTTIGAAEARTIDGQPADPKTKSAWVEELKGTAERTGRDPEVVAAMADRDLAIPGLVEEGELLTLRAQRAVDLHIADFIAADRTELIAQLGYGKVQLIEVSATQSEKLAQFLTNPYVSALFLALGIAGLALEIFTAGWGVPGLVGLISFTLFFGGHLVAGLAGWESIILFLAGIILIILEVFVIPGFGLAGLAGIGAVFASILLAAGWQQGLVILGISLFLAVVVVVLTLRGQKTRRFWNRFILNLQMEDDMGYTAPKKELLSLVNARGKAVTPLRPAGTVEINGNRVDVVTDGSFIKTGEPVRVIEVVGSRVVVKRDKEEI